MNDTSRRQFLQTASIAVAGAALVDTAHAADATAGTASTTRSPAFAAIHQPKPLPFDAAKLHGISEKLIRSHWENNYGGAVKTLNAVKLRLAQALADKDTPPFAYDDLKREHLMRTGSVVFHELYFENLGGDGNVDANLRNAIGEAFGDFDTWETEFRKIGAGLGGGSGWVILGYNVHTGQIESYWLSDHLHGPAATLPLLVMDMYEHAYQMDYGAAAAKYIDAFFQNVRWEVVATRLSRARISKSPVTST
ncbi:MAG: superoxide dismutase [Gammaproteobacteria bacterium]|nr:superoxide dismutase [Gammaproteobacteria bacterium]